MFSFFKKRIVASPEARESAAQILTAVAEGMLSPTEGRKRFEGINKMFPKGRVDDDRVIDHSWHALCHFEADADIRQRDAEYAIDQKASLHNWARKVRADK